MARASDKFDRNLAGWDLQVYALATVESGADLVNLLVSRIPLTGIIGLEEREASHEISGYAYMLPLAEDLGLEFVPVQTYVLSSKSDRTRLTNLKIDVLIVAGWQRLVPSWLIDHVRLGVIGSHGSAEGIAMGRGRSPQNWALITGGKEFNLSIFFIDAGIDCGRIIATGRYTYDNKDDIASSRLKATLLNANMIVRAFEDGAIAAGRATDQPAEGYYLPQRLPGDGAIDWSRSSAQLDRFVAALTRPYPGAFCTLDGMRITIWRVRPFTLSGLERSGKPGCIVLKSMGGKIIVETGDGFLLVDEYECSAGTDSPARLRRGVILESVSFREQVAGILARHREKYPEMPVSPMVEALIK